LEYRSFVPDRPAETPYPRGVHTSAVAAASSSNALNTGTNASVQKNRIQ
jgi:hypothetical protein